MTIRLCCHPVMLYGAIALAVASSVLASSVLGQDKKSPDQPATNKPAADKPAASKPAVDKDGWQILFDGKTMNGWRASENKDSWKLDGDVLVCNGDRSHLFYVGDETPFVNFEFQCESMTTPGSNSGIYFHTKYQETNWPKFGYECQVNISHTDKIKSGSLYGVQDVSNPPAKDNEWYTTNIRVEGKRIVIKVNDQVMVDFTEPEGQKPQNQQFDRRLGSGTFALQAHDPKSKVSFRNIKVKRLP